MATTAEAPAARQSSPLPPAPEPIECRITSVTYRRVRSLPNYQSEAIEATVPVGPDEPAGMVLDELADWVHGQLGIPRRPRLDLTPTPPSKETRS